MHAHDVLDTHSIPNVLLRTEAKQRIRTIRSSSTRTSRHATRHADARSGGGSSATAGTTGGRGGSRRSGSHALAPAHASRFRHHIMSHWQHIVGRIVGRRCPMERAAQATSSVIVDN
jgi:hypothetical protein